MLLICLSTYCNAMSFNFSFDRFAMLHLCAFEEMNGIISLTALDLDFCYAYFWLLIWYFEMVSSMFYSVVYFCRYLMITLKLTFINFRVNYLKVFIFRLKIFEVEVSLRCIQNFQNYLVFCIFNLFH